MKLGLYEHFKGMPYQVIDLVIHSETQEEMVLYRALYGERRLFVRPKDMFFEDVTHNGQKRLRFKFISEIVPEELR